MSIIIVLAVALTLLIILGLARNIKKGLLWAFLSKPIIDATWAKSFGGVSTLHVIGTLVPIFVIFNFIRHKIRISTFPLFGIWLTYVIYSGLTFSFNIVDSGLFTFLDLTFRILNGFIGFFVLQAFFREKEEFRKLLVIFIFAGFFPVLMGVYQGVSGVVWTERMTVGLSRNVGMYHDASILRFYGFQTLTAIILYWSYFLKGTTAPLKKLALLSLVAMTIFTIYRLHSKAAYAIGIVWFLIWVIAYRKYLLFFVIIAAVIGINSFTGGRIFKDSLQLFSKEIIASQDEVTERDKKRTLGGRWYLWETAMEKFNNRNVFQKLFGTGSSGAAHNDFLRNLFSGGYIGLMIYCILLLAVGMRVFKNYLRRKTPINIMAAMLFSMWLIDAMGLVPSLYPSYQWYIWGFIGLAIKGFDWENQIQKKY